MTVKQLDMMTALQFATALEQGAITCEALARACVERIETREPVVHAWSIVDAERTIERGRELDRAPPRGLMHGVPVGVKDIIATADFPTEYGSPIYVGHRTF